MEIKRLDSPNYSGRRGTNVDMIIIHCASLPEGEYGAGYVTDLFLNRLDINAHPSFGDLEGLRVSAHYLIERDGSVIQYVDTDKKAWHAGVSSFDGRENCNLFSIGIELEGDIRTPYTGCQYASLIELCGILTARYTLISRDRLVRHSDVAPGRKKDPGQHFDLEYVRNEVFVRDESFS